MPMSPWRRFRPTRAEGVSGSEEGVNYTSHHLRCERIDSATSRRVRRQASELELSRSWPGTTPPVEDEEDSFSNIFTPQAELRYTSDDGSKCSSRRRTTPPPSPKQSTYFPLLRVPPRCRLPTSIRFTTLILYLSITLLFISTASAAPFSNTHAHIHLQNRQSIPDQLGNTGNEPAPVKPDPPPRPFTPSATATTLPSFTLTPSATLPTSTANTGTNGNSNNNNSNSPGGNPGSTPPAEELQLTKPQLSMSPGALAGIIGGGIVVLIVIISLLVYILKRRRRPDVAEIPIRRSKLGSRLGRRIFGSPSPSRAASRSSSRRSSASLTGGEMREKQTEGWLDKGTISRPKPAFLENGLLSVPKPEFMKEEKEKAEEGEKWVNKESISLPRPARPVSAEPLGRLSGLGMGMGYLK